MVDIFEKLLLSVRAGMRKVSQDTVMLHASRPLRAQRTLQRALPASFGPPSSQNVPSQPGGPPRLTR